MTDNGPKLHQGKLKLDIRKNIFRKSGNALEQRAGGATVPRSVQEMWRCSTEGCDVVGMMAVG